MMELYEKLKKNSILTFREKNNNYFFIHVITFLVKMMMKTINFLLRKKSPKGKSQDMFYKIFIENHYE